MFVKCLTLNIIIGHDSAELEPSGMPTTASICRSELSSPGNSNNSQPLNRNDDNDDDDENDDDDDNMHNSDEEEQEGVPDMLNRSPPPELQDFPEIPHPNVLRIGGLNNAIARERSHMWGAGVRLGVVEHNPHTIDPVLRVQSPGESAVRRLEMRQHLQPRPETGRYSVVNEVSLKKSATCTFFIEQNYQKLRLKSQFIRVKEILERQDRSSFLLFHSI